MPGLAKVFCPDCVKAGQTSRVTLLGGSTTDMFCAPFYDDDGAYHHHDLNITSESFSCSNGHRWASQSHSPCPNPTCDWPNEKASG